MISDLKEELLRLYNLLEETQAEKKDMDGGYNDTIKDLRKRIKQMKLDLDKEKGAKGDV